MTNKPIDENKELTPEEAVAYLRKLREERETPKSRLYMRCSYFVGLTFFLTMGYAILTGDKSVLSFLLVQMGLVMLLHAIAENAKKPLQATKPGQDI